MKKKTFILLSLLIGLFASCNGDMEQVLRNDYAESENANAGGRHVLYIIVDGVSGQVVQTAYNTKRAPVVKDMIKNSIYTFEGLADSKSSDDDFTNEHGWANMMTGKTANGSNRVSFLSRLGKGYNSQLYAVSQGFYDTYGSDATQAQLLNSDIAVKDALVSGLSADSSVPNVVVAEFRGVYDEGVANGFTESNGLPTESIVDAFYTIDIYLGEIRTALESRPDYSNENWLIIVSSNYGGDIINHNTSTYYDYRNRQTFTMMYNVRLTNTLLQKPAEGSLNYQYYTPEYRSYEVGYLEQATVNDPSLFDIEIDKPCTVQFFYRSTSTQGYAMALVSKKADQNDKSGWYFSRTGTNFQLQILGSSQRKPFSTVISGKDPQWHVITLRVEPDETSSSPRNLFTVFLDGEIMSAAPYTNTSTTISNPTVPLTIGCIATNRKNVGPIYITNLQFYDVALPDEFIKKNYGKDKLDQLGEDFEYWDHLIGYWPCDREEDFLSPVLRDYSKYGSVYGGENAGRSDMRLSANNFNWLTGNNVEPYLTPTPDNSYYKQVFNTVDIPYQIMLWMGIYIDIDWKLDGIGWPFNYSIVG